MKLGKWIDEKVEIRLCTSYYLVIQCKFWLLCQPEVSVPFTYNGRNCGSSDNLNTARYFLMKLNKWIDGVVEIMNLTKTCVAMAT